MGLPCLFLIVFVMSRIYSMMYGLRASSTSSRLVSVWIAKSIGLDKSKLKIPMMDFASMTYLPEIKSKSYSN